MRKILLDGMWTLECFDYGEGKEKKVYLPDYVPQDPIEAWVPGEVHLDLLRAGRIDEPLFGENAQRCQWIEEREWWYLREFAVDGELLSRPSELVFEGIDTDCEVYLNGEKIASHQNMFVPLVVNVSGKLRERNRLAVRVDSGSQRVKDRPVIPYPAGSPEQDYRRVWVRKAQFTFAWDWAPRLLNVGIWRSVYLRFFEGFALREPFIQGNIAKDQTKASITLSGQVENFFQDFAVEPLLRLRLLLYDKEGRLVGLKEENIRAYPGLNTFSLTVELENPRLWWPNGMGEAHLYRVELFLLSEEGKEIDHFEKKWGLKEIKIAREFLAEGEGESFTILVNGEKVFCKGANWVPADSLIPRVSQEKYRKLIDEAKEAHFNMFRIWGGGIYEDPFFYEYCAEQGIMLWQDFMFACAYYPNGPDFLKEVEREIQEAVKRLRNETAIVLWCGNNELQWLRERNKELSGNSKLEFPDYEIYHIMIPKILRELDPTRPFWLSSPYGGEDPNSEKEGDRHSWDISIILTDLRERVNYENYAQDRGKFISEFGILAPPNMESIEEFIPKEELYLDSPSWRFHNNVFERENIRGMLREFIADPEKLSFEEYIRYAQLLQGEALKFALEHWRRRKFNTSGALFWMYSDCWGAIGWTIIDYYLRRKPSYYFVRRAFQPIDLSLKKEKDLVSLYIVNDSREEVVGLVDFGLSSFSGDKISLESIPCQVRPNSAKVIGMVKIPKEESQRRQTFLWAKLWIGNTVVDWERCFFARFKELEFVPTRITYELKSKEEGGFLEIVAPHFAWFVEIKVPSSFSPLDNYFDLFPGERRVIEVRGREPLKEEHVTITWNNCR